jgi:hypothetical protein
MPAAAHQGETVAVSRLDRLDFLRRQIRFQGPVWVLAVLHTKCPVVCQPLDNGFDVLDCDGDTFLSEIWPLDVIVRALSV